MPSNWIEIRDHAAGVSGIFGPGDIQAQPDAASGYKKATVKGKSCKTCIHFTEGICHLYGAKAKPNMVCNDWKTSMPNTLVASENKSFAELFFSQGQAEFDEDSGLIWKEVLKTGILPYTPSGGGRVANKPLVVKVRSDRPDKEVSFDHLIEAFQGGAKENVTVPLSHENLTKENTGFVKSLVVKENDEDGHSLWAGLEITEPDIKGKIERKTIRGNSVGIEFAYTAPDGKEYAQVLDHNCLTNKPFFRGLKPFGVEATEVDHYEFADKKSAPSNGSQIMWDPTQTYEYLKSQIEKQISGDFWIMGMSSDKVLVSSWSSAIKGPSTFVVEYTIDAEGDIQVEDPELWEPVSQEWVSVDMEEGFTFTARELGLMALEGYPIDINFSIADEAPLGTPGNRENWVDKVGGLPKYVRRIARNLIRERGFTTSHAIATAIQNIKLWSVKSKNPKTKAKAVAALAEWEQKKASSHANLNEEDPLDEKEVKMPAKVIDKEETEDVTLTETDQDEETPKSKKSSSEKESQIQLAEKQEVSIKKMEVQLAEERKRSDRLAAKLHTRDVDDKIDSYKKAWGDQPDFLKKIRSILMEDDGEEIMSLNLSEDDKAEAHSYTVSEIVDEIMSSLPESKIKLSEQVTRVMGDEDHPANRSEKKPREERTKEAVDNLGISMTLGGKQRKAAERG